jgi:hypothetical protein
MMEEKECVDAKNMTLFLFILPNPAFHYSIIPIVQWS